MGVVGIMRILQLTSFLLLCSITLSYAQTYGASAYLKPSDVRSQWRLGMSLAVDGDLIAAGRTRGHTYIYERSGDSWSQLQFILPPPDGSPPSLALDGDTLVQGFKNADSVRVMMRGGDGLFAEQQILEGSVPGSDFGVRVAVAGDWIAVTTDSDVQVFKRSGTTWSFVDTLPIPWDGSDFFGDALEMTESHIIVGARHDDSASVGVNADLSDSDAGNSGAAYIFKRDGDTWVLDASLKASNSGAGDEFGSTVAIAGNTVVVGASGERSAATGVNGDESDNSKFGAGAGYAFELNPVSSDWSQTAYLKALATDTNDKFGISVAVGGDVIALGSIAERSSSTEVNGDPTDNSAINVGAVQLFRRDGISWAVDDYLKAPNAEQFDRFGLTVAVLGTAVVVGADAEASSSPQINTGLDLNNAINAGAVYVFTPGGTIVDSGGVPAVKFGSRTSPVLPAELAEGDEGSPIVIERTTTEGSLTIHFRLGASSTAGLGDFAVTSLPGNPPLTFADGVYSVTLPDGVARFEATVEALQELHEEAEAMETINLQLVESEDYFALQGRDTTYLSISPQGFLVTNTFDNGSGSLRQALENANVEFDANIIDFSDGSNGFTDFADGTHRTISLTKPLEIHRLTTLNGPGKCFLTITGNSNGDLIQDPGETRIFTIVPSGTGSGVSNREGIFIRGFTLRGGVALGEDFFDGLGGLIFVESRWPGAVIEQCNLIGGRARNGGAVANFGGAVILRDCDIINCETTGEGGAIYLRWISEIIDCRISGNRARGSGGGIYIRSDDTVVRGCTISHNFVELVGQQTRAQGGGIYVSASTSVISDCYITHNTAKGTYDPAVANSGAASGGGIAYIEALDETPQQMTNTTVANNRVIADLYGSGGGIYLFIAPIRKTAAGPRAPVRFYNCSILNNSAEQTGRNPNPFDGRPARGGGVQIIASTPGTLFDYCTISGNRATEGAGLYLWFETHADFYNSILAGNVGPDSGVLPDVEPGILTSLGYNLYGSGDHTGVFSAAGDQSGIADPGVEPLAYSGGTLPSYTLSPDSPALNAGDPETEFGALIFEKPWLDDVFGTDQRRSGFARIVGGRVDIGAIEVDPSAAPVITPEILSFSLAEGSATLTFTSEPGERYTLAYSTDLRASIRLDKVVTAAGTVTEFTHHDPSIDSNSRRFYRVLKLQ